MKQLAAIIFLIASSPSLKAQTITNVTNAALPSMDNPPNTVTLSSGSLATVFGVNLSDSTASTTPPWKQTLAGVEVHLVPDSCYDSSCELVAGLLFVSPTQINFQVPIVPLWEGANTAQVWKTRTVIIKNGQRFDNPIMMLGGPGRVLIDAVYGDGDEAIFGVGYDCLFSFSLIDPNACGLSWAAGTYRVMVGAVTDTSGQLITNQNPVFQGRILTFWLTGMTGNPWFDFEGVQSTLGFGVAQQGVDFKYSLPLASSWAGPSPQFPGLDQMNAIFPVCGTKTLATAEKRYDVWFEFSSDPTDSQVSTGTTVRIYMPLVVRPGDPDCDWSKSNP